jgi:hypothetical protein
MDSVNEILFRHPLKSTHQRMAKQYLINGIHLVSEDIMRMSLSNLPVICKEMTHIMCFIGMEDGTYAHPLLPSSYPFLVKTHLVKFALENFFHLKYLCMRGSFTHVSLLNSLKDAGFSVMENPFKIVTVEVATVRHTSSNDRGSCRGGREREK